MAEGSHSYISGRLLQGEEPKVSVPHGHVERRKISTLARNTPISPIIQVGTWCLSWMNYPSAIFMV